MPVNAAIAIPNAYLEQNLRMKFLPMSEDSQLLTVSPGSRIALFQRYSTILRYPLKIMPYRR